MGLLKCILTGVAAITLAQLAHAQAGRQHFTREVSFTTDNDNYLLQRRDGYYTNGLYLAFQHLAKPKRQKAQKAIMRYELGQMIYNPYKYSITDPEQMDRPFAGFLFARVSRSKFWNGNNLQYGITAGVLGKASAADKTQRAYHDLINIYGIEGWDYQLKDEAALNLHLQYTHALTGPIRPGKFVDLHAVGKASAGNVFTNATAGLIFRFGEMENSSQSIGWSSRLHGGTPSYMHSHELFILFQPEVMYQVYNATLQGGLFRKDKGPVTASPMPWVYQQRIGLMYATRRFSGALIAVHRTKEARHMMRNENYGSIQLGYRF